MTCFRAASFGCAKTGACSTSGVVLGCWGKTVPTPVIVGRLLPKPFGKAVPDTAADARRAFNLANAAKMVIMKCEQNFAFCVLLTEI